MPPRTPPWWHSTTTRSRSCRSRATLNICSVSSRSLKVCEAKALRAAPASPILTTWCSSPCHHLSLQSCHCGDPKRCAGTKLGPSSSRRTTPRRWWCPQWAPRMVLRCAGESTDGMLCCCFLPFLLKILSSQFKPFLWAVWCRKLIPGSVPFRRFRPASSRDTSQCWRVSRHHYSRPLSHVARRSHQAGVRATMLRPSTPCRSPSRTRRPTSPPRSIE